MAREALEIWVSNVGHDIDFAAKASYNQVAVAVGNPMRVDVLA